MISIEKPTIKKARELKKGESLFLKHWIPREVSPYVAYYNREGLNLKTEVVHMRGIWGTAIKIKETT